MAAQPFTWTGVPLDHMLHSLHCTTRMHCSCFWLICQSHQLIKAMVEQMPLKHVLHVASSYVIFCQCNLADWAGLVQQIYTSQKDGPDCRQLGQQCTSARGPSSRQHPAGDGSKYPSQLLASGCLQDSDHAAMPSSRPRPGAAILQLCSGPACRTCTA